MLALRCLSRKNLWLHEKWRSFAASKNNLYYIGVAKFCNYRFLQSALISNILSARIMSDCFKFHPRQLKNHSHECLKYKMYAK